jgi:hypothetical protein
VSTVYKVARGAIRDALLLRKVARFLFYVKEVPLEKRKEFAAKVADDDEYRAKVGDNLVLVLERANHLHKADIVGRIHHAHLEGANRCRDAREVSRCCRRTSRARSRTSHRLLQTAASPSIVRMKHCRDLQLLGLVRSISGLGPQALDKWGISTVRAWRAFVEIVLDSARPTILSFLRFCVLCAQEEGSSLTATVCSR